MLCGGGPKLTFTSLYWCLAIPNDSLPVAATNSCWGMILQQAIEGWPMSLDVMCDTDVVDVGDIPLLGSTSNFCLEFPWYLQLYDLIFARLALANAGSKELQNTRQRRLVSAHPIRVRAAAPGTGRVLVPRLTAPSEPTERTFRAKTITLTQSMQRTEMAGVVFMPETIQPRLLPTVYDKRCPHRASLRVVSIPPSLHPSGGQG